MLTALRGGDHSSGPGIAARLMRPPRRLWRAEPACVQPKLDSLPIWSCSVWGLPCPPHYCAGGALLPHLFTLTCAFRPGRDVFCATLRPTRFYPPSPNFSPPLLRGARTLPPSCCQRPSGPGPLLLIA